MMMVISDRHGRSPVRPAQERLEDHHQKLLHLYTNKHVGHVRLP